MRCPLCFHHCDLKEGETGFCLGRINRDGRIVAKNYGMLTSLALDPIEKKPLYGFYPGSMILSAGSFGCNLKCPFCQNYSISYDDGKKVQAYVSPKELVEYALTLKDEGNIGIAFTYNEPLISYEYVYDTCVLAKKSGLQCVLVTNGTINPQPLQDLLPYIDAMNIDLKGFRQSIYDQLEGNLQQVKKTIALAAKSTHVEVTSLIVPGLNDSLEDMDKQAQWLSSIDPDLILHITRFFPRYHMLNAYPTSIALIDELIAVARRYLNHVYRGNC
ncbi:MAG: AmmeMemoRadiSam system radical SAM enzyme [bacterium]